MRLLYVAATRVTHSAKIFTNNYGAVCRQIIQAKGDKASALEAMGCLKMKTNDVPDYKITDKVANQQAAPKHTKDNTIGKAIDFDRELFG